MSLDNSCFRFTGYKIRLDITLIVKQLSALNRFQLTVTSAYNS